MEKKIQIAFITFVFLLLAIPAFMLNTKHDQEAASENRMLAELVSLSDGIDAFMASLNDYVSDRVGFRTPIVRGYRDVTLGLIKGGRSNVMVGKEGWMYLSGDLPDYSGTNINEETIEKYVAIAKELQDWCRERGITFVLAIAPNKSTIYSEYMPDYVRRADVTFLDLLLKRLDEENVLTVCPKQALLEHRFEKPLYQRLDTHWNGYGSYYMLQELVQKLGLSEKDIPISEFTTSEGDLRKILGVSRYPYTSVDTTVESVPGVKTTEGTTVILNAPGNPTFICYRDSYASALEDYLSYYFDGIMYWQHEIDLDFVEQKRPQYLVLECVERFLPEIMGANQEKCENRY